MGRAFTIKRECDILNIFFKSSHKITTTTKKCIKDRNRQMAGAELQIAKKVFSNICLHE